MALVYFSALSDLYKPRPQRDLNSTQRLFRYLILAQIGLMLAIVAAGFLSAAGNNEIAAINDAMDSGHPGRGALAGTTLLAYVIVNVCLYKFWKGARTAYLIVTVVAILETLYLSPSATSAGTEIFTDGITILNGALLGLAYFSPLRAVFDGPAGTRTVAAPAPVMSPPVGSPVTAVSSDSPHPHFTPAPVAAAPVAPANTASPPTTPVVAPASRAAHTRFCSECGARVDDAKFCPECGQRQRPKDECAGCGAKLHVGSRFCAECGVQVV
jgi:cell division septation protein DedD